MSTCTAERITAQDIMTSDIVCLNEDLELRECEKILLEKGISGAPVVDVAGHLLGVLSKTDLVSHHFNYGEEGTGEKPTYKVENADGFHVVEFNTPKARDLMTPVPCVATEWATIHDLAALMVHKEVHRVVICRRRKIVGIVTSMDILRAIASDLPEEEWDVAGFPG